MNFFVKIRCVVKRLDPDILTQTLYVTVMVLGQLFMVSLPGCFISGYTFLNTKPGEE